MIRIGFGCDGARGTLGKTCYFIEVPEHISLDRAKEWIDAEMQNREWVRNGDKHFCPEHNPALKGEQIMVSSEYVEIAPGVRVRLPGETRSFGMEIEVQRDDRECHGNVGAVCGGGTGPYGG